MGGRKVTVTGSETTKLIQQCESLAALKSTISMPILITHGSPSHHKSNTSVLSLDDQKRKKAMRMVSGDWIHYCCYVILFFFLKGFKMQWRKLKQTCDGDRTTFNSQLHKRAGTLPSAIPPPLHNQTHHFLFKLYTQHTHPSKLGQQKLRPPLIPVFQQGYPNP